MKIEAKSYRTIVLSDQELDMLEAVEKERQKECDEHDTCDSCSFLNTFFCHGDVNTDTAKSRSHEIKLTYKKETEPPKPVDDTENDWAYRVAKKDARQLTEFVLAPLLRSQGDTNSKKVPSDIRTIIKDGLYKLRQACRFCDCHCGLCKESESCGARNETILDVSCWRYMPTSNARNYLATCTVKGLCMRYYKAEIGKPCADCPLWSEQYNRCLLSYAPSAWCATEIERAAEIVEEEQNNDQRRS